MGLPQLEIRGELNLTSWVGKVGWDHDFAIDSPKIAKWRI